MANPAHTMAKMETVDSMAGFYAHLAVCRVGTIDGTERRPEGLIHRDSARTPDTDHQAHQALKVVR
jgi:hypothetical protein